jgi:hypothetical protein
MDANALSSGFNIAPELAHSVHGTLLELARRNLPRVGHQRRQSELIGKRALKILTLTLELSPLRRMRHGRKSATFAPAQFDMFQETGSIDFAAFRADVERPNGSARGARSQAALLCPSQASGFVRLWGS